MVNGISSSNAFSATDINNNASTSTRYSASFVTADPSSNPFCGQLNNLEDAMVIALDNAADSADQDLEGVTQQVQENSNRKDVLRQLQGFFNTELAVRDGAKNLTQADADKAREGFRALIAANPWLQGSDVQKSFENQLQTDGMDKDQINDLQKAVQTALDGQTAELGDVSSELASKIQISMNHDNRAKELSSTVLKDFNDTAKAIIQHC
jgi:hypothetical protein